MKKGSRKARRFDEGGFTEDEDKAEGLAKSKGEKVGLLERLRMGNIDDPTSQAYKQFGAGRARAAREAADAQLEAEAMRSSARAPRMGMAAAAPAMDELEEANKRAPLDTTAGPRAPMPAAPARPVARPPAPMMPSAVPARPAAPRPAAPMGAGAGRGFVNPSVSDLQAATRVAPSAPSADEAFEAKRRARLMTPGADALEGVYPEAYLGGAGGALRALLGMGKTAAAKAAPSTGRALAEAETPLTFLGRSGARNVTPAERVGTTPKTLLSGPRGAEAAADTGAKAVGASKEAANRAAAKAAMEGQPRSQAEKELLESTMRGRANRAAAADKKAKRPGPTRPETSAGGKDKQSPRSKTKYDEDKTEYRKGGKIKAFAKGGSVSSASSRADGCAMRGKTRGRIY